MGALYLGLGWWMARRTGGRGEVHRWLAECFAALGLGFVTLAVPLALDARWTSAVWAIEGAAVFWMGRRQDRWLARAAGLALQGLAARRFPGIACQQRGRAMAFRPSRLHRRRDAGPGRIRHRPLVARPGAACARRNGGRVREAGAWFVALALLARFPVVAIRLPQRDRTHAAGRPRHRGAGVRRRGAPAPAPAGLGGQRFRLAPSRLAGARSGPGLSPPRPRTRCCR